MKKSLLSVKAIAEIAMAAAVAYALDILQGGLWRGIFTNGGSIGLAMLPVLIMCYRRGFVSGLLTGLALSFIKLLGGFYAVADTWYNVLLQILLDYILAYPFVSIAGIFFKAYQKSDTNKQKIKFLCLGALLGGLAKLLCHYLAGVIFWSSSCPDGYFGGPAMYSLVYNGSYMIPNIIIMMLLLALLQFKQPSIFIVNDAKKEA